LSKRYEELDSLRGLASSSVVIHHTLLTSSVFLAAHYHEEISNPLLKLFAYSPLHLFWAGHEAVILFFVLSGFVLSIPFTNRKPNYGNYVIKRVTRIYLPYIFSIALSYSLYLLIQPGTHETLSSWFNHMWSRDLTMKDIFSFLLMYGEGSHNINTVIWSLVHEMRISLFFPLLMLFVNKYSWKTSLIAGVSLFSSLWLYLKVGFPKQVDGIESLNYIAHSFSMTFYYTSFFLIGALVAKNKDRLSSVFNNFSKTLKMSLIMIGTFLYTIEWWMPKIGYYRYNGNQYEKLFSTAIIDYAVGLSVIILFVYALNSFRLKRILHAKPLLILGKVSYSLYLIHPIVLLSSINLLKDILPYTAIFMLVPIISIIMAVIMYKFIEEPSMKLGKWLVGYRENRKYAIRKLIYKMREGIS
jgi:peptidoglycan/LPS O-acetylase OafA/YrhL